VKDRGNLIIHSNFGVIATIRSVRTIDQSQVEGYLKFWTSKLHHFDANIGDKVEAQTREVTKSLQPLDQGGTLDEFLTIRSSLVEGQGKPQYPRVSD
jgi:hypothetical protein